MTGDRPLPQPDADTAFFWEGCARGELLIQRCTACNRYIHPPRAACPACSAPAKPARVSGRGVVHSHTVTHKALPGFTPPFGVVLVELEEQKGLRLVSNLSGVPPEEIEIGMQVEVEFADAGEGVRLPMFRRRGGA